MEMFRFSARSLQHLNGCDHRLQTLFKEVVKTFDCSIVCGRRSHAEQQRLFDLNKSRARPGESKHNVKEPWLSLAVDVLPFPHEEDNPSRFFYFCGFVKGVASRLDIPVRCGVDWYDELYEMKISDRSRHTFDDLAHWEIVD